MIMRVYGWETADMFRRYAITTREDMLRSQLQLEEFQAESRTKAAQNQMPARPRSEQVQ